MWPGVESTGNVCLSIRLSIHPPICLGLNPASAPPTPPQLPSPSLAAITRLCQRFNSLYLFIIAIVS